METKGAESLDKVTDARGIAVLDLDEDVSASFLVVRLVFELLTPSIKGTLDVMVQRTGTSGQGKILFIQNNFYYDAFFLKAIGAYQLFIIDLR